MYLLKNNKSLFFFLWILVKVKEDIKFYLETQEQLKVLKNLTDGLLKTAKIVYIDESYDVEKLIKNKAKVEKTETKNEQK